jgi:hypothetical protein
LTDHDRRVPVLVVFCAIAAGMLAVAELVYLLLSWILG